MVGRVVRMTRDRGLRVLLWKVTGRVAEALRPPGEAERQQIRMLVRYEDAVAVDWTTTPAWRAEPHTPTSGRLSTAWIMHPPGESSGGHQNIFRFIRFLEDAGHEATVYLYHAQDFPIDAGHLQRMIAESPSYPDVRAEFVAYDPRSGVAPGTDAIVATGWETAYPAYLDPSRARRLYFVQDFEPAFYPVGSEHVLAENTYRFGFHGVTAGRWLSGRLGSEYGMTAEPFSFGADVRHYSHEVRTARKDVFFYARPVTTRRGFELGVMALQILAERRPDITIHLAGWDVSSYDLPFRHVDHGAMKVTELNALYNRCGAALVLSLTNLSLLPLELLAAGVIPVVNAGDNNALVAENDFIEFCELSPRAMADRLVDVLDRPDLAEHASRASASVADASWEASGRQFVEIVTRALRG
ncbi:glycosyltransferase [Actinotalea ferrariae CF5-4]|uniref:Glycosyltransferase n=1 Tax=Actinotalea ferrariae CF5-4 TaxID=948458 RepID=A0A021W0B6_9CELL|nr:glycosyltransferase [Actinotalea ferrariae CF5-4]